MIFIKKSLFIVMMLLFTLSATALPSAFEIRNNVGENSSEVLQRILEIHDNVGDISTNENFQQYFALLPLFERKATEHELELIYPDIVSKLADKLASHGMRWINIEKTPQEEITQLIKVMKANTALRFLNDLSYKLSLLNLNNENLVIVNDKLLAIKEILEKNHPDNKSIHDKVNYSLSSLSLIALQQEDLLSKEQIQYWTTQVLTTVHIENYLVYLHSSVLETDKDRAPYLMTLVLTLGSHLNSVKNQPLSLKNMYGDIIVELVGRSIEVGILIDTKLLEKAVLNIGTVHLKSLAFRVLETQRPNTRHLANNYVNITYVIGERLKQKGVINVATDLIKTVETAMAPVLATIKGHEGTYHINDEAGKLWIFTLARTSEDRLIASLGKPNGMVTQSFFNIKYSVRKKKYTMSDFVPDDDPYFNMVGELFTSRDGLIHIHLPFAKKGHRKFKGKKVVSYPDYFKYYNPSSNYIEGAYSGTIKLPSGTKIKVIVTIFNFDEYSIGRLESHDSNLRIELQQGTQGGSGFIYLTSGQTQAKSWFHLRLKLTRGSKLRGYAIIGGKNRTENFVLHKINN